MRGFISYSHQDQAVCTELRKYLGSLQRAFDIEEFWVDEATTTGRCFRHGYQQAVEAATIFILLISTNSLNSSEIMDREIPLIEQRYGQHDSLLLPLVIDDCLWRSVVGTTLASPRSPKLDLLPLLDWRPRRKGYEATAQQFSQAIGNFIGAPPKAFFDWKRP